MTLKPGTIEQCQPTRVSPIQLRHPVDPEFGEPSLDPERCEELRVWVLRTLVTVVVVVVMADDYGVDHWSGKSDNNTRYVNKSN
jgi:hypothetical protein